MQAGGELEGGAQTDGGRDDVGELVDARDRRGRRATGAELGALGAVVRDHRERVDPAGDAGDLQGGRQREVEGVERELRGVGERAVDRQGHLEPDQLHPVVVEQDRARLGGLDETGVGDQREVERLGGRVGVERVEHLAHP